MFYRQTDPDVLFRNSGILKTTEIVWPVSSDKWQALLVRWRLFPAQTDMKKGHFTFSFSNDIQYVAQYPAT